MSRTSANSLPIFAVVLAAGQSRRYGSAKLLAELDGEALVARATRLAASVCADNSLLVVGHRADEIRRAAVAHRGAVVENRQYAAGIGSSISLAVRTLADRAAAILLMLADQPLITETHLRALLAAWSGADHEIIASAYAGVQGPPVLLPAGTFAELQLLSADHGAQALLRSPRFTTRCIACEAAATDIDTPDDLGALLQSAD